MEWWVAFIGFVLGLILLILAGFPVFLAFMILTMIGMLVFMGETAGLLALAGTLKEAISSFTYTPMLLFVLLGELLFYSGLVRRAVHTLDLFLGRLPGRLSLLGVVCGTLFAFLSGSGMASTAMLGTTLLPEMRQRGYTKSISIGPILGCGELAVVIPPSMLIIILGGLAQMSIGKLLIAGIVPGLIMSISYITYIIVRCARNPAIAPSYEVALPPIAQRLTELGKNVVPLVLVIILILSTIFLGIATPSEAAAVGVAAIFILIAVYRELKLATLISTLYQTVRISAMIFLIISFSTAFSSLMAYTGASGGFAKFMTSFGLTSTLFIVITLLVLIVLGFFIDQVSTMMITIPLLMPIVRSLGIDEIWFAILFLVTVEIGTKTPPFGISLFVMKGIAPKDVTMSDIWVAAFPFVVTDLIVVGILIAFPILVTALPSLMR